MADKKKTGFALQDPEKRKQSARKGGLALQEKYRKLRELTEKNEQNTIQKR